MFDIGWTELLLIGIVALIVVGPKDLPGMFRTLGKFTAKLRAMAREFQRSMNEAADDAGMGDVASDLRSMTSARSMGLEAVKKAAKIDLDDDDDKGAASKSYGEHTAKLAEERAEAKRKIEARTAEVARARQAAEAKAASSEATGDAPVKKTPAKKAPARKTAARKAPAKKPAAAKTAATTKATRARKPAKSGSETKASDAS